MVDECRRIRLEKRVSTTTRPNQLADPTEAEIQAIGRQLWQRLGRRRPSLLERRWWDDRLLDWAMTDESVKVQMFRFVDVLPMLKTHASVTRHLREYFDDVSRHLPWAARLVLDSAEPDSMIGRAIAVSAKNNALRMAKRFIAGTGSNEVLDTVRELRDAGLAFTLDLLGEAVVSESEASQYQQKYLELIDGMAEEVNAWPESPVLDRSSEGMVPRLNVSLKLSALDARFNPADPIGTYNRVAKRLRPILRKAQEEHAFVNVDMEQYAYKPLTLDIFRRILMEDEFRTFQDAGIVIQAYLRDSGDDLASLLAWVEERGTPVWVRLVKGAYWDYETVVALSHGWPVPVYRQKWESDENFERLTRVLMKNHTRLRPAIASHNLRSLTHALACAKVLEVPRDAFELQMLYGMAAEQAELFAERGYRVRIYAPFGELIPGMAYLVRRLLENTSNDSFLKHSYDASASIEELLMNPTKVGASAPPLPPDPVPEFQNEPPIDFSQESNRQAMLDALEEVRSQFGREYSLVVGGRAIDTTRKLSSLNPSNPSETIGVVAAATPDQATDALEVARRAFPQWMKTDPAHRAEYLELVAAEMRHRRFELAAWIVFECGKPWRDADADVAEAIDFCVYYAAQMRRLAEGREVHVPGEENSYFYRPRGVAVVIAPWNFPLAILTGMTAAALVTGNTVVMKPAEQSPIIAAKLMEIFRDVGIPDGVVNYLTGVGEEIGPELVGSPLVDLIAFTGSREVGLGINAKAAETDPRQTMVKHVIAEMGGKNAIIIDDDADLDEAVAGVVQSAFGYAGQKCSACSRAIVLDAAYDAFLERLIEATKSLKVGPAEDPGTDVGPLIDEEARDRVKRYVELGAEVSTFSVGSDIKTGSKKGYYVTPHIFTNVRVEDRIATEEIFGPVLAVFRVRDLDEAFKIANGTNYALTAGIYSRSPENLRRARRELVAGNIYLNRGITGALVHRQPFGGFKMSGIGTKAGGPDYLLQFLIPVNVTENTMRRGFAPEAERVELAGE